MQDREQPRVARVSCAVMGAVLASILILASSCGNDAPDLISGGDQSAVPADGTSKALSSSGGENVEEEPTSNELTTVTSNTTGEPTETEQEESTTSPSLDTSALDTSAAGALIEIDGELLSSDYTEPASWGGLQFSFRNVTQTTYNDAPAIAVEFFAKSTIKHDIPYKIRVLSLVQPGLQHPTLAVGLVDNEGNEGAAFHLPAETLFYGVAFFPVDEPYTSVDDLSVRIGTFDAIYSDVPLNGTRFEDPEYPIFIDIGEHRSVEYPASQLGIDGCSTTYTAETTVVITASDPIRYIPTAPNLRYVFVEAKVEPVATPDPLCPESDLVAKLLASVISTDLGEAVALVSDAQQSTDLAQPMVANYVAIWQIPAAATQLVITPSHPTLAAAEIDIQLDLYTPELGVAKTLEQSKAEREDP